MKKRLTTRERAFVGFTTFLSLIAGFTPVILRAANTPAAGAQGAAILEDVAGSEQTPIGAATAHMRITAYSSSPDETDYNPFYTASGMHVRDGIVASNKFPFGTRIQIPELFGEKIFVVEDRMAKRFQHTIDIWMNSKSKALRFGVNHAEIIILEGLAGGKAREISKS